MLNRIWIPIKVSIELSKIREKWTEVSTILNEETNDTYYYVNGKYICHEKEPFKIKE